MCMGGNATNFLSDYHQSRSRVCVNPCTTPRRRDITASTLRRGPTVVNETLLFARNLANSEINLARGPDGEPSWG